ncbi:hypothetical protein [Vibrio quintilis]|uniref:Uncharacterized protein n=1 Tax=Vibrio quintilis TaxID=1117707 RepID=A0A1M7YXI1_9VIBR|nr:hypothetical protein [Vibrio quintilis]SHO57377.1 hypothetical protein VQ7734_03146 [Vibrio quintilis]
MGFFDKVKAIKNMVTGGAAKVYLECPHITYDEPFTVKVKVETLDAPVKISNAYLHLRGCEEVRVPDIDVAYERDGELETRREIVTESTDTVNLEIVFANAQELEAENVYEWEVEVEMPSDAPRIYRGRFCEHTYEVMAGLDCFGNDPDSGWIDLHD